MSTNIKFAEWFGVLMVIVFIVKTVFDIPELENSFYALAILTNIYVAAANVENSLTNS